MKNLFIFLNLSTILKINIIIFKIWYNKIITNTSSLIFEKLWDDTIVIIIKKEVKRMAKKKNSKKWESIGL